jgi:hypothetical protein
VATAARIGKNEDLFREVNERIRELNDAFDESSADPVDFVCECSLEGCRDYVPLTLAEYRAVRATPTHFLVAPGHAWHAGVEHAIERNESFWIVEKLGEAADVASERDTSDA